MSTSKPICTFCSDDDVATYSVCLKCLQTSPNWHKLEFHLSLTDNEPFSGGCDYCNHPCREVVYDVNLCDEHVGINDVDEHPEYEHIQTYIDLVKLRMSCPDISKSYKLYELSRSAYIVSQICRSGCGRRDAVGGSGLFRPSPAGRG